MALKTFPLFRIGPHTTEALSAWSSTSSVSQATEQAERYLMEQAALRQPVTGPVLTIVQMGA